LFPDPKTLKTANPILYADCEGTRGSETPVTGDEDDSGIHWPSSFRPIEILWGEKQENGEEVKSRYHMVRTLFPRVLYIFSDVVVYVLSNKRRVLTPQTYFQPHNLVA
jgi:hypothetical protein